MSLSEISFDEWKRFVAELAHASAFETLALFRTCLDVTNKNLTSGKKWDPVTQADRNAERALRKLIQSRYPDHGVTGEEEEDILSDSPWRWILDPIDGTRSFLCGLPVWGTLIGLLYEDQPVFGAMSQPFTGELFYGDNNQSFLEHAGTTRTLRVRKNDDLSFATGLTACPDLFEGERRIYFKKIRNQIKNFRYGTDCYGYAALACGQADFVMETGLKIYDIAPLIPIVRGAGGVVSDWRGNEKVTSGDIIACGSRALQTKILANLPL